MRVLRMAGSYPPMRCGVGDYSERLAYALTPYAVNAGMSSGWKKSTWGAFGHVVRICRMMPHGMRLRYVGLPLLYKRSGNDSSWKKAWSTLMQCLWMDTTASPRRFSERTALKHDTCAAYWPMNSHPSSFLICKIGRVQPNVRKSTAWHSKRTGISGALTSPRYWNFGSIGRQGEPPVGSSALREDLPAWRKPAPRIV